ncbi:MAG: hypothetical protein FJ196_06770 [Gammaproteobacteria bacterium]|nr:hypothetical protein [Gammaproteobacteria bacterium]
MSQPIVLAYSGGLDTSFLVPWLKEQYQRPIITVTVDTGGIDAVTAKTLEERALNEFTIGEFTFGAGIGAVAITASANASASTAGASAGVAGGKKDATTTGEFYRGFAVFTIAKGGLMYEAAVAGKKFSFTPAGAAKPAGATKKVAPSTPKPADKT